MTGEDAALRGIMPGDRVVEVDGRNVETLFMDAVYWLIAGRSYGKAATLTFDRDGARYSRTLTVAAPNGP
jgi:C-terminal processing protease CtpA/Prc